MIFVLYVDALFITGCNLSSIDTIKTTLHQAFDMSDLGMLKQFLGLEINSIFYGISSTNKNIIWIS